MVLKEASGFAPTICHFLTLLSGSTYRKAAHKMLQCCKSNRIATDSGNATDNSEGSSTVGAGNATGNATGSDAGNATGITIVNNLQVPG